MATFIEVNAETAEPTVINLESIKRVVPNVRNDGTIIHIDQNTTISCNEKYDVFKKRLLPVQKEKDVTKS